MGQPETWATTARPLVGPSSRPATIPMAVDGDVVVVESRRVVRHLYSRHGDDSFARSIAELDRDILADGNSGNAPACELPTR